MVSAWASFDGGPEIKTQKRGLIERPAVGVMGRKSVHEPLMTGIMSIDAMFPIGRGQRELIIGDRQTGKTSIAIDTMINQARQKTGVINVYVAIGQKLSKIARLVERLKEEGVMDQTIIVATSPVILHPRSTVLIQVRLWVNSSVIMANTF